jgi:uncharacterized membrane protein YbaN (DUF454 family)
MTRHIWRAGKISLGVVLLALGLIGLMLPLIPQIPFLIGGLTLLSSENRHCKALLEYIERRVGWRRSTPDESAVHENRGGR